MSIDRKKEVKEFNVADTLFKNGLLFAVDSKFETIEPAVQS